MDAELFKPFKTVFWVLKPLGLWQDGNQSWTYFILGYAFHLIFYELYSLAFFIRGMEATNAQDIIDSAGLFSLKLAESFKAINFFIGLRRIKKLFGTLTRLLEFSADDRWKNRDQLKQEINFALKIYKIMWISAFVTCSTAVFVPVLTHKLPYKMYMPFNILDTDIGFWFFSFLMIATSFPLSLIGVALDMLAPFFIAFAVGLVKELECRLNEINSGSLENDEEFKTELVKCIEIHKKIKNFTTEIEKSFSKVFSIQGCLSSIILCASAFTLSTVRKLKFELNSSANSNYSLRFKKLQKFLKLSRL